MGNAGVYSASYAVSASFLVESELSVGGFRFDDNCARNCQKPSGYQNVHFSLFFFFSILFFFPSGGETIESESCR